MTIPQITESVKNLGLEAFLKISGREDCFDNELFPVFNIKLDAADIGCYSWIENTNKYSRVNIISRNKDNSLKDLEKLAKAVVKEVKKKYKRVTDYKIKE